MATDSRGGDTATPPPCLQERTMPQLKPEGAPSYLPVASRRGRVLPVPAVCTKGPGQLRQVASQAPPPPCI